MNINDVDRDPNLLEVRRRPRWPGWDLVPGLCGGDQGSAVAGGVMRRWLDSILLRALLAVLPYAPKWRNSAVTYTINRAGDQHLVVLHFIDKHGNEVTMQATGSALVIGNVIVWMDDSWVEAPRG